MNRPAGQPYRTSAGRLKAVGAAMLGGTALLGAWGFAPQARAGGPLPTPLRDGGSAPAAGGALTLVNSAQVAGGAAAKPTYAINGAGTVGTIEVQASRTLIDWSTYQVNAGYTLDYVVANASDIVLNRVPAGATIQIYGSVTSTLSGGTTVAGNLWFLAPSGVFFHDGSSVSAGGILATTGSLSDSRFLDPANDSFDFTGANGAVQVGDGGSTPVFLKTSGGDLALISRTVSSTSNASIGSMGSGNSDTASVLYGGASDFTVAFVDQGYNGLDLFSFQINTGTDAANALALQGATQSGRVYVAAVNAGTAVQGLIQLGGSVAATNASLSEDNLVLSAGSGLVNTGSRSAPSAITAGPAISTPASISLSGSLTGGEVEVGATWKVDVDGAAITTRGAQTYDGAVLLGADTTLTATRVLFNSTLDGGYGLSISGAAVFDQSVGGLTPLASLSVSGSSGVSGGTVTTIGTQTYTGPVSLGAPTSLTGSSILFGATVGGPHSLSITGDAAFSGVVGTTSLSVSGASALSGGAIITSGMQTYTGAVTLGANTSVTASTITFEGAVDGGHALWITGAPTFDGAVGASTPLTGLAVSGSSTLDGGPITTTGAQAYNGAVVLGADTTLTAPRILLKSTLDGAYALSISGAAVFNQPVGGSTPLASLSVSGSSDVSGGPVTTTGIQSYTGPVVLGAAASLTGSSLVFKSSVDGPYSLSITGDATFGGAVGGVGPLSSLVVVGQNITLEAPVTTTGELTLRTTASSLAIAYALTAGGELTLSAAGPAADLTLDAPLSAGVLTELDSTGDVNQKNGTITTPTIGGTIGGSATLNASNRVKNLSGLSTRAGLSFTDAGSFSAADVDGGPVALLTANSGNLTLTGDVAATTLVFDAPQGALLQTGGVLTAALLQGKAGGSISLADSNALTALANLTAPGPIAVVNRASLMAGGVTAGSSLSLSTLSGDLTVTGALTAGAVSLSAGGGIQQTGGIVTAASLAVTAGQSVALDKPNAVAALLASSSGGGFAFDNASGFSVTQVLAGTGDLSLTALSGDVQAGTLQAGLSLSVYAAKGSASVATATTGGDVRVVAGGGSASVGTAQAGDNIFVVGATGASLQSATLTPGTTVDSDIGASDGLSLSPANAGVRRLLVESLSSGLAVFGAPTQAATSSIDQFSVAPGVSSASISTEISGATGAAVNLETAAPITLVQASTGSASGYVASGEAQVGTLSAPGGLSLVAGGDVSLGQALTAGALTLEVGGDLKVGGGSVGTSTTVLSTSLEVTGVLATPTLTIQARGGAAAIGGSDSAAPTSLRVSQASFDNIQAGTVNLYAGSADGAGPNGVLTVDTLALNQSGGQVSALNLFTRGEAVLVDGALTPGSGRAVALNIGTGAWTPSEILIMNDGAAYTGSLGAATAGGGTYSGIQSFASLDLSATGDIIAGTPAFIRALQAAPAADAVAVLRLASPVISNDAPAVFIAGASIALHSGGRIVGQDSSGFSVADTGVLATGSTASLQLGGSAAGATPSAIDLFGAIASGSGFLSQSNTAVANQQLVLMAPLVRTNLYRFNGCVIGEVGACSPLNTDIVVIQPDRLTLAALLKPYENQDAEDPTIIAGANEEVWLNLDLTPPRPPESPHRR